MRKILDFLKQGWVISLLGFLALAVFIWFGGPLIAIAGYAPFVSALSRLILILTVLLLWVLNMLRKHVARTASLSMAWRPLRQRLVPALRLKQHARRRRLLH
jgi:type VI protein secretion system component VasK